MGIEVMLDLETLSLVPNAAIIQIGAVKFDPRGTMGVFEDSFNVNVDMSSLAGFDIDGHVVSWWLGSSENSPTDEVRKKLFTEPLPLFVALSRFYEWFGGISLPTWGNGSDFDNVIMQNAYTKFDGQAPWKFRDNRCFRTVKAMFPDVEYINAMQAHDALRDAEAQALHVQKLYNRIITK